MCWSELIFVEINFRDDLFYGCKFWDISRGFVFADREILIQDS